VVWEGWRRETSPYPDLWVEADLGQPTISVETVENDPERTCVGGAKINKITEAKS